MHARIKRLAALAALAAGVAVTAAAVQRVTLRVADITGTAWQAMDIRLGLTLGGDGQPAGTLSVGRLALGPPVGTLDDVHVHCPRLRIREEGIACPDGTLRVQAPVLDTERLPVSVQIGYDGRAVDVRLPRLPLTFNAADGERAAEQLMLAIDLAMRAREPGWRFDLTVDARAGQAYVDPIFADFEQHPAHLEASGRWSADGLNVGVFRFAQPGVVTAGGALQLDPATRSLHSLTIDRFEAHLSEAYALYAQPFLIGTPLDALTTTGRMTGTLGADASGLARVRIEGRQLNVRDRDGRFRIEGAQVDAHWRRDAKSASAQRSRLSWESADIYRIALGSGALDWRTAGDDLRLTRPARIPLLEGALNLETFEARNLAGEQPRLRVRAHLEPIQLAGLTEAFGWPPLGGTLGGDLPELTYREGRIELSGGLDARLFDGRMTIEQLSLAKPFGPRPRASMDVTARGLDLALVTQAFSFGRIEGSLDADIDNLRMLGWQPVAFDAWLRTPRDDDARHRISQRAVDNVASLGSGGAGLASRGFLRFFDDFAYDRIGIGCRLTSGICHMRGLGPADNGGFVIVRGSWRLPRIDVIGHTREVSWPTLVEQLRQATQSEGPVVQ